MNKLNFLIGILAISLSVGLTSCGKTEGCTNPKSTNYDPDAEVDDGSCQLIKGCTDPNSTNYNADAGEDDGSCQYVQGCTDPNSPNYNPNAQQDDGSCQSVADLFVGGNWSVTETVLGIPTTYDADITKIDDNTVLVAQKNRPNPPNYAPASFEIDLSWSNKTVESANNVYSGSFTDGNSLEVTYEVQSTTSSNFDVDLQYTR